MKLALGLICLFATSCVTMSSVSDVSVGKTYEIKNGQLKGCEFIPANIITVIPKERSLQSTRSLGTEALLCGSVKCALPDLEGGIEFQCLALEALK